MLFQYVFLRQMRQYRKPLHRYRMPLDLGGYLLFFNYPRMQPSGFLPPGNHVRICPYINNEWGLTLDCFNIIICLVYGWADLSTSLEMIMGVVCTPHTNILFLTSGTYWNNMGENCTALWNGVVNPNKIKQLLCAEIGFWNTSLNLRMPPHMCSKYYYYCYYNFSINCWINISFYNISCSIFRISN